MKTLLIIIITLFVQSNPKSIEIRVPSNTLTFLNNPGEFNRRASDGAELTAGALEPTINRCEDANNDLNVLLDKLPERIAKLEPSRR